MTDESEEKMVQLLNQLKFQDFWVAFTYLVKNVGISEFQAFSVCIRKFTLAGAFDPKCYSFITYSEIGFHDRLETQLEIVFGKVTEVPFHLRQFYKIMSACEEWHLLTGLSVLTEPKKREYSIKIIDSFLINSLTYLMMDNYKDRRGFVQGKCNLERLYTQLK